MDYVLKSRPIFDIATEVLEIYAGIVFLDIRRAYLKLMIKVTEVYIRYYSTCETKRISQLVTGNVLLTPTPAVLLSHNLNFVCHMIYIGESAAFASTAGW